MLGIVQIDLRRETTDSATNFTALKTPLSAKSQKYQS